MSEAPARQHDLDELPAIGPAVVALGVFDGVHLGHRHLLARTVEVARRHEAAAVAIVFDPHPQEVLRPGSTVLRLTPPWEVPELLKAAGADHAPVVRFDAALSDMSPGAFLAALAPAVDLRGIVMTPESAFGRGRSGTLERMRELGAERGFEAVEVTPVLDGAERVSSSMVRAAVLHGDLETAARLLARPPGVVGTVVHGDRRGRQLGFPTANLAFAYPPALPPLGIYLGRVTVAERSVGPGHPALVSIGVRPTFHDDGRVLVEAYLLDWDGDLYDAELRLDLLERIRAEQRFDSVGALVAQMRDDESVARRRFRLP